MKNFLRDNANTIVRVGLYQFGAAFLGIMVQTPVLQYQWLTIVTAGFATMFYLFLLYNLIWERGGQDRIRVDGGRAAYKPFTGFYISLAANAFTILLGICIIIGRVFGTEHLWAGNLFAVTNVISRLWNAMYMGFLVVWFPNNPYVHLLHVIPALLVTGFGYWMGLRNYRLFGFLSGGKKKAK